MLNKFKQWLINFKDYKLSFIEDNYIELQNNFINEFLEAEENKNYDGCDEWVLNYE